jgi:hypothetical protein
MKAEIEQIKTTITTYKKNFDNGNNQIKLIEENSILFNKLENLFQEKLESEKRLVILEQLLLRKRNNEKAEIEKINCEVLILNNKLDEKEYIIKHLKNELKKGIQSKNIISEHYVTEPTVNNLEINNEINYTNDILVKMIKIHKEEKEKYYELESHVTVLNRELDALRKNSGSVTISTNLIDTNGVQYDENESLNSFELSKDDIKDGEKIELDSPLIRFPDKVFMNEIKSSPLPKLDFNKIKIQTKKNTKPNKKFSINISLGETYQTKIDNYNNEISNSNNLIEELNGKIEKFQNLEKEAAVKNSNLKDSLTYANSRVALLKEQIRKLKSEKNRDDELGDSDSFDLDDINFDV